MAIIRDCPLFIQRQDTSNWETCDCAQRGACSGVRACPHHYQLHMGPDEHATGARRAADSQSSNTTVDTLNCAQNRAQKRARRSLRRRTSYCRGVSETPRWNQTRMNYRTRLKCKAPPWGHLAAVHVRGFLYVCVTDANSSGCQTAHLMRRRETLEE